MDPQPVTYYAYLLRLWREQCDGQPIWRASLEATQDGKQIGFASLQELTAFLEQRTILEKKDTGASSKEAENNLAQRKPAE